MSNSFIIPVSTEKFKRPSGALARLAKAINCTPNTMSSLCSGRINAGPRRARLIAAIVGSPIEIWLQGGDAARRRQAVEEWRAKSSL